MKAVEYYANIEVDREDEWVETVSTRRVYSERVKKVLQSGSFI